MPVNEKIIKIIPKTCGDANPDEPMPNVMASLSNLVPDPNNVDVWVPRPAAQILSNWSGAFSPGIVSAIYVSGTRIYGMVSSALNPGKDQPFSYDTVSGNFDTFSGITAANTPTSPASSGAWTPPTMDGVGKFIVVTHPGFTGGANGFFGTIDISAPAAPVWASGNTATNALPAVPTFVKQFRGRAVYVVPGAPPSTYHSDQLDPKTITVPRILTYGDNLPLNALGVLGLRNITGGITQALLIFKSNNIFQITGDFASDGSLGTISLNSLNIATGTTSPLSVTPTPRGVAFLSPDGFRIIDWESHISEPVGLGGTGVTAPFTQSLVPSRVIASCNGQTVRATTQNNAALGQPFQEWVFDLERQSWHGPHTFPSRMIAALGKTYVMAPVSVLGMWQSDILPTTSSQYTENGTLLTWLWQSSLLPNVDDVNEQSVVESTVYAGVSTSSQSLTVSAVSEQQSSLDTVSISPPLSTASLWGTMVWGVNKWGAAILQMSHMIIPWDTPIVFDRASFSVQGNSGSGVSIGEMRLKVEDLEYMARP